MTHVSVRQQWALVAVAVSTFPLAGLYLTRLWPMPHYQFFPILFLIVAAMLKARWPKTTTPPEGTTETAAAMTSGPLWVIGAGLVIEAVAIAARSPWFGFLAFLVVGCGVLWKLAPDRFYSLFPVWAMLLLIVRPPLGYDEAMIRWLQQKTAAESSLVLDLMGVDHLREGVVIEIPGKTLFVEEACSGVQSLFSLMTTAVVISVWKKRRWSWTLLLIGAAVLAAGAMNVLRTISIVAALQWFHFDLLSEPAHTIFGIVIFALSLGWLWSADQMLGFLGAPILNARSEGFSPNFWVRMWDRRIANRNLTPSTAPLLSRSARARPRLTIAAGLCGLVLFAAASFVVTAPALARNGKPVPIASTTDQTVIDQLNSLGEQVIPEQFGPWRRTAFQHHERQARSLFGDFSQTWSFGTPYGSASCSIDYPFTGMHDLRECYSATGWTVAETTELPLAARGTVLRVNLVKSTGEHAYLVFGQWNGTLDHSAAPPVYDSTKTFASRVRRLFTEENTGGGAHFQIQALVVSPLELTAEQRTEVEQQLDRFRETVRAALSHGSEGRP